MAAENASSEILPAHIENPRLISAYAGNHCASPSSRAPPRKIATLTARKEESRQRSRNAVRPPSLSEMSGGRSTLTNPRATRSGTVIRIGEIVRHPTSNRKCERTHEDRDHSPECHRKNATSSRPSRGCLAGERQRWD